jgi:hypothetical protein
MVAMHASFWVGGVARSNLAMPCSMETVDQKQIVAMPKSDFSSRYSAIMWLDDDARPQQVQRYFGEYSWPLLCSMQLSLLL